MQKSKTDKENYHISNTGLCFEHNKEGAIFCSDCIKVLKQKAIQKTSEEIYNDVDMLIVDTANDDFGGEISQCKELKALWERWRKYKENARK